MQINCISIKGFEVINRASFLGFRWQCRQLTVTKNKPAPAEERDLLCGQQAKDRMHFVPQAVFGKWWGLRLTLCLSRGAAFCERMRPSWKPEPSAIQPDRLCLQWMSSSICHRPRPLSCSLPEQEKRLRRNALWDMWATKDLSPIAFKFRK